MRSPFSPVSALHPLIRLNMYPPSCTTLPEGNAPLASTVENHRRGELSVIVPCHNEAEAAIDLCAALERLKGALAEQWDVELLFVDDGSTDGTATILRDCFQDAPFVRILRHDTCQGIAAAIGTGLRHARSEVAATLDADCTYDPMILVPMLRKLSDRVDLVVASPYHPEGGVEGVPAWRLAISRSASRAYRLLLRQKLHTYTSCVRVYRRSAVVDLPLRNNGFVGVVELVWQLDRRGGCIVEQPAVLRTRKAGQSKMRVVRATMAHFRLLARAATVRLLRVPASPLGSIVSHAPSK